MYQQHANSHFAAHMIAAAERHEADIVRAERISQLRAYGGDANRPRRVSGVRSVRHAIGLVLIHLGTPGRGQTVARDLVRAR